VRGSEEVEVVSVSGAVGATIITTIAKVVSLIPVLNAQKQKNS